MFINLVIVVIFTLLPKGQEIEITSKTLSAYKNENKIIFKEDVVLKSHQDDLTIYSEAATAIYTEGFKDIRSVLASGNVRMFYKDKVGTCSTIEYKPSSGVIIFKGRPVIWDKDSTIRGEVIEYLIKEERIKVKKANVFIKREENKRNEE